MLYRNLNELGWLGSATEYTWNGSEWQYFGETTTKPILNLQGISFLTSVEEENGYNDMSSTLSIFCDYFTLEEEL